MPTVQFPCPSCGAGLAWDPAAGAQKCPHCGHTVTVPAAVEPSAARELDYHAWAGRALRSEDFEERLVVACGACGAETTFEPNVVAAGCAFCGAAITAQGVSKKLIKPACLLPFRIGRDDALKRFGDWVRSRWFAPNALKTAARAESNRLRGIYIPFWTYDARTTTRYTGERGEDYQVPETYTTTENGKTVTRTRMVTHTRWHHASGTVHNAFDDVLVPASQSVPRPLVEQLEPWDLAALVSYRDEYLAGFQAESYQVDLPAGFERAKELMAGTIDGSIRSDIGGDHQRIHSKDTAYADVTFKHLLLPLWICSYRFREKVYRFVVNARTGEVQGERPWSWVKITLLVLAIAAVVLAVVMANQQAR